MIHILYFSMSGMSMYYYDDLEVDRSQSDFVKVQSMNERVYFIAHKMEAALADLVYRAVSLSNAKSSLYGEIDNGDARVLMYSLPTKLIMNTAKLFGDSIKGNIDENTIIDIVAYSLYIHSLVNANDYKDIGLLLSNLHNIIHQRHYDYNSADLVYDRLSVSDIASVMHIKAIRIKNLFNHISNTNESNDIELVKSRIVDSVYDIMIYAAMVFLKLNRV
jgi:hypothetical protein